MNETSSKSIVFIQTPIFLMKVGDIGYIAPHAIKILYEIGENNSVKHFYTINLHHSYNLVADERLVKVKRVSHDDFEVDLTNPHIAFSPCGTLPEDWKSYTKKTPIEAVCVYTKEHFSYFKYYELMQMYNEYLEARKETSPECIWCLEYMLSEEKAEQDMFSEQLEVLWDVYKRSIERIKEMKAIKKRNPEQENALKINLVEHKSAYKVIQSKITSKVEINHDDLQLIFEEVQDREDYLLLDLLLKNYPQLKSSSE